MSSSDCYNQFIPTMIEKSSTLGLINQKLTVFSPKTVFPSVARARSKTCLECKCQSMRIQSEGYLSQLAMTQALLLSSSVQLSSIVDLCCQPIYNSDNNVRVCEVLSKLNASFQPYTYIHNESVLNFSPTQTNIYRSTSGRFPAYKLTAFTWQALYISRPVVSWRF